MRGAQPTTYVVNNLHKKRSSRIEGPILSQKLGEDQQRKKKGLHDTNLSLLALRLGPPPGYAYAFTDVHLDSRRHIKIIPFQHRA